MKLRKNGGERAKVVKRGSRTIFPTAMEESFVNYIKFRAKICYGMSGSDVRKAAYTLAVKNGIKIPQSWETNQCAGMEWFLQFRNRHPSLSLRKPQPCSLSRATSFNKHNVNAFFDNLEEVFQKNPALGKGTRIYNLDETALTTVQSPQKVLAGKETRQLNQAVSAERGTLVTGCCFICANGTYLPPVLVFPRKKYKRHMINGAPAGTLGLAHTTGWMTSELFLDVMAHFVRETHSSKENPTLLIFDNHETHLTADAINYARENGVIIVTLPPHCSHKLQPLDVGVYKSLKSAYYRAMDSWMFAHPGETVTIYEIAAIFNEAFVHAMSPGNIISSFRTTGIFPFNRECFTDDDFMSSFVTDRPAQPSTSEQNTTPPTMQSTPIATTSARLCEPEITSNATPSFSNTVDLAATPQSSDLLVSSERELVLNSTATDRFITPIDVLGVPKAKPRKKAMRKRAGRTMIATNTPEKLELEEKQRQLMLKKKKKESICVVPEKRGRKPKVRCISESSSEEDDPAPLMSDESDLETFSDLEEKDSKKDFAVDLTVELNDYCVVKFDMDETKAVKHYVGRILQIDGDAYEINFLRKTTGVNKFVFPNIPDVAWIEKKRIVTKLVPLHLGTTSRQNRIISFIINVPDRFENVW